MNARNPFSKSNLFAQAVRRLLRPLVRALIAQGVTAPALYRIVKQTYVEVAADELGAEITDSRVSVMTGIHRRDVKEFRGTDSDEDPQVSRKVSLLVTVVGRWISEDFYTDQDGAPLALPRSATTGPNFDALVQSVSRDVRPRTVLDELSRQGILREESSTVHLLQDGLFGAADTEQKLHFFAHNLGDHMQASVENLMSDPSPHFERAVFYNFLTQESVAEIEGEARQIAMRALQQINTLASARQTEDKVKSSATYRFRFGQFFFAKNETRDAQGKTNDDAD